MCKGGDCYGQRKGMEGEGHPRESTDRRNTDTANMDCSYTPVLLHQLCMYLVNIIHGIYKQ